MKFRKQCRVFILLMLVLVAASLTGCSGELDETVIPKYSWQRSKIEKLVLTVTEEDFPLLEECESLKTLDVTGSTCYEAIVNFANSHPNVDVIYTVPIGGKTVSCKDTALSLNPEDFSYDSLCNNLKYLPRIKTLNFPKTQLTLEQISAITAEYPHIQLSYTVEILGSEYAPDVTALDLSSMDPGHMDGVMAQMAMLPQINHLELANANGESTLSPVDVKKLMDAFPDVSVRYSFDLFGKTVSTEDTAIEFKGQSIGNAGETAIRQALDILPNCTRLKLEDCGLSNEVLGSIQADYPNTKIVWRVYMGQYSILTDEEMIRTVGSVYDEDVDVLKYCTSVKYIDMGHNGMLSDISFVSHMPDLEIVIVSGSSVKDLTPFASCKKLMFLELAYCGHLVDVSPLKDCENLQYLNISYTGVKDLTPLYDLPLKRFVCLIPQMSHADQKAFEEQHPECWIRFDGKDPYNIGWRYDDIGVTRSEIYIKVREVFKYDEVDARIAQEEANKPNAPGDTPSDTPAETTPPFTLPFPFPFP